MNETVSLIADLIAPAAIVKLLAVHVDDGLGHCRDCKVGAQRGYRSWPCLFYTAATVAVERRHPRPATEGY